ncbi:MAG: N-acetyltransferase [Planctomycetaceae bacterium]|nr:N-acetyltransferase [Planctomycetaceae bacterium]
MDISPDRISPLLVELADPRSSEAAELIRRLTDELTARYDFLDDGAGNFRAEDALVAGAAFLIGRAEGQAAACAALRPMTPGVGEIKRVFVDPRHRGRGYGRALLAELERIARELGYHTLRLETGTRQPESIRLYESSGYRRIPNFEPYVESHWSVCYEKTLDGRDDATV